MRKRINKKMGRMQFGVDLCILFVSALFAYWVGKSGVVADFATYFSGSEYLASFVAGLFFTSAFTTIPAIVVLGQIAQIFPLPVVATFGALGAMSGDYLIFRFVRDRASEDIEYISGRSLVGFARLARTRLAYRLTIVLGGLIIASPFPDELGIAILGLTRMKTRSFLPISFVCNALGIVLIGLLAR